MRVRRERIGTRPTRPKISPIAAPRWIVGPSRPADKPAVSAAQPADDLDRGEPPGVADGSQAQDRAPWPGARRCRPRRAKNRSVRKPAKRAHEPRRKGRCHEEEAQPRPGWVWARRLPEALRALDHELAKADRDRTREGADEAGGDDGALPVEAVEESPPGLPGGGVHRYQSVLGPAWRESPDPRHVRSPGSCGGTRVGPERGDPSRPSRAPPGNSEYSWSKPRPLRWAWKARLSSRRKSSVPQSMRSAGRSSTVAARR